MKTLMNVYDGFSLDSHFPKRSRWP